MSFLLDTNVISEWMRARPNPRVLENIERHRTALATAAVVMHELRYGVERMQEGRRRNEFVAFLSRTVAETIPVLPYELTSADWHAVQRAHLAGRGITPSFQDGQIAAVAAVNGLTLVTRNVRDFEFFEGLVVENWFS